jgi:hypothetical protein
VQQLMMRISFGPYCAMLNEILKEDLPKIWITIWSSFVTPWAGDCTGINTAATNGLDKVLSSKRLLIVVSTITAPVSSCNRNRFLHFYFVGIEQLA